MANIAREDAAAPAPPKKDGCFGLGKAAGYGTLYKSRFEDPFRKAVRHVVETYQLPDEMSKELSLFTSTNCAAQSSLILKIVIKKP